MELAVTRTDSTDLCAECRIQPSDTNRVFCSECRKQAVLSQLEGLLYQYAKRDKRWITIYVKLGESITPLPPTIRNKIAELRELCFDEG